MFAGGSCPVDTKIREIRQWRGLTQEQLAKQARTTAATISRWENYPSRVSVTVLQNLARILDVSPADLLADVKGRNPQTTNEVVMIRGIENSQSNPFDPSMLESLTQTPAADLAMMCVKGDAMVPTLCEGDQCLVDTSDTNIYAPGIYCIQIGLSAQPRRLSVNPINGRVNIRCDNHTYGDYLEVEPNAVKVIGRIIWLGHKL
jgi:transcriptional regulator with XRE-family HTH domain